MNIDPVYPKDDPEAKERRMQAFYKKVRATVWETPDDRKAFGKVSKGRKGAKVRPYERFNTR